MFARFRFFEPPNGKSFSHAGWLLCRKDVSTAMIYAGVLNKGIEKSLTTPRRVVDKFYEAYHEGTVN